jgi:hypothetical protein
MLNSELHNPFGQLINPESIAKAIAASERLSGLHSRVCRPLDRPLIPGTKPADAAVAAFDAAIERQAARRPM